MSCRPAGGHELPPALASWDGPSGRTYSSDPRLQRRSEHVLWGCVLPSEGMIATAVVTSTETDLRASSQAAEAGAHLVDERLRLLEGGEVPALGKRVEVDEFGETFLRPAP
jgi:hypothetical protein